MKLATSLLSSVFLLSALSNVTGVRLHSSKNLKESDLDSPAALRALKKGKGCRSLQNHPTWAKATGYWFGTTYRYYTEGDLRAETFFFDRTIAQTNYIASKSVEIKLDHGDDDTTVVDTEQNTQLFGSPCIKSNKKQRKKGIFQGTNPSISTLSVYADPNISKGGDAILYEVSFSPIGMVQQSVERFVEADGKVERYADTDFYVADGTLIKDDGFAHGSGEKSEKDAFYAKIEEKLLEYGIDATTLCGVDNCETFFEDSSIFG